MLRTTLSLYLGTILALFSCLAPTASAAPQSRRPDSFVQVTGIRYLQAGKNTADVGPPAIYNGDVAFERGRSSGRVHVTLNVSRLAHWHVRQVVAESQSTPPQINYVSLSPGWLVWLAYSGLIGFRVYAKNRYDGRRYLIDTSQGKKTGGIVPMLSLYGSNLAWSYARCCAGATVTNLFFIRTSW